MNASNSANVVLDSRVYPLEAVQRALLELSEEVPGPVVVTDKDKIEVGFGPSQLGEASLHNLECRFLHLVNEQALRCRLENEARVLRDIIVAQAFAPCENLGEVLKLVPQND